MVQNSEGKPIAGALVRLFADGADDFPDQTTPEDGTSRFAGIDVEAGPVSLLARAEGYAEFWIEESVLHPGDNVMQVVLEPGAEVHGCVLAPDGTPAKQTPVCIGPDASVASGRWEQMEWTDDAGQFRFSYLRPGTTHVILAVDSRSHWIASGVREVKAGSEVTLQLDAVAYRQVAFLGTVKDALSGLPLPEFSVCVFVENTGGVSPFFHGTYELAGYPANRRLRVVFDAPGHVERSVAARIYEPGDHRFDMLLFESREVTFRLITPDRQPATGAELRCLDCDGTDVCCTAVTGNVDHEGLLQVTGIPAGPCTIEVRPYCGGPERRYSLDFSAPPAGVVELQVEPVTWYQRSVSVYGTADPTATVERLPEHIAAGSVWPIEGASVEVWEDQERVFWHAIEREGDGYVWKTSSARGPAAGPTVGVRIPAIPLRLVVESSGYQKVELPIQPEQDARTTVILVQSPDGE
ncbi:MAG: carboxypeptidase regulatory-like domain-containing protein [Planctomycetes bacterium]|nr:carboxypeptidase regulatory-like domain-containing protein [Planctomycetota bacterium]